jgi:regulator of nucleoside diphosphate kinase
MHKREIFLTEDDLRRLKGLVDRSTSVRDSEYIQELRQELSRATVVPSAEIPRDVITMESTVKLRDLDSGEDSVCTLVYPGNSDPDRHRISILAPIGTALIGYRAGDIIECSVPAGTMRLKVLQVLYQPEAAGDVTA